MTNNMTIAVDLGRDITHELLIEQLGGYEKAKEESARLTSKLYEMMKPDNFLSEMNNQEMFRHAINILGRALLSYRRANNIFEFGDFVLTNNCDFSEEPCQLIEDMGCDFKYKTKSGRWGFIVKSFLPTKWRHATDAKIEANRRLD